jgi:hypothetical protein
MTEADANKKKLLVKNNLMEMYCRVRRTLQKYEELLKENDRKVKQLKR